MTWLNNIFYKVIDGVKVNVGNDRENFVNSAICEFENSPKRLFMDVAQEYYDNRPDQLQEKRMVIGRDSENNAVLQESRTLTNTKLTFNFMRKFVTQKISYQLSLPFSVEASREKTKEKADDFIEQLYPYLNDDFYRKIKKVSVDSIVKGIGWLYVYYDEQGEMCVRRLPPEEVIPFWADVDHTELEAVVRYYWVREYKPSAVAGLAYDEVKHIEYYGKDGIEYFIYNDSGKVVRDPNKPVKAPYIRLIDKEGKELGYNWNKLPFIPFKYNDDEHSLLLEIKPLVDNYNKIMSDISNDIIDMPNSVTVIKNYDGASKEEFIANKNQYRTIFVQGDGDASKIDTNLNIEDIDIYLKRLRADMYEHACCVDATNKDIRDTSGVALRFIFADLDMDCKTWGSELQWALKRLFWFFQQDMIAKGKGDYADAEYHIIFNNDMIINETEAITNCFTSKGVISDETIAANHPWTIDAKKEVEAMLDDEEEELSLNAEYAQKADNSANQTSARRSDGTSATSKKTHSSNGQNQNK